MLDQVHAKYLIEFEIIWAIWDQIRRDKREYGDWNLFLTVSRVKISTNTKKWLLTTELCRKENSISRQRRLQPP